MKDKVILHCDINNFYASVEAILNPKLKDKPIAVCGSPELRHGIVLAKSQMAKNCGVNTGDLVSKAKIKCPGIILVEPSFSHYNSYSKIVYNIYKEFTFFVESFGQDECWLDLSNLVSSLEEGAEIAKNIKQVVNERTGGLTLSIGVSFNKVFAKLGSDYKKPDGLTIINKNNFKNLLYSLPVENMLYVGAETQKSLNKVNVFTIGDLANANDQIIISELGNNGIKLLNYARGKDDDSVDAQLDEAIPKSVGNGTTLSRDISSDVPVKRVIYSLSEIVAFRLRKYNIFCKGVCITIKDNSFISSSKQSLMGFHTCSATLIAETAYSLFKSFYDFNIMPPIRAITITTYDFAEEKNIQMTFFDENIERHEKVAKAIDVLRQKYGFNVLLRGGEIETDFESKDIVNEDRFFY